MKRYIEGESLAEVAREAIIRIADQGEVVKRRVGGWALQKEGYTEMHEIQGLVVTINDPLKRWCTRINSGILLETEDYLLALNPGFTHLGSWKFYDNWRTIGMEKYPYTYGGRIFGEEPNDIDQFFECVRKLRADPTTRHASIPIWRPIDQLRTFVPCNVHHHYQIGEDGKLDMITICRSQDMLRGFFLDCFAYTHFLEQMCLQTGIPMGTYTVFEMNAHIYERDMDKLDTDFANPTKPYGDLDPVKLRMGRHEFIEPSKAELLTDDVKRRMYNQSIKFFEKEEFSVSSKLPDYWRDWKNFQAYELSKNPKGFVHEDIRWTVKKVLGGVVDEL